MAWYGSMCAYILLPFWSPIACSNFDENGVDVHCKVWARSHFFIIFFLMKHVICNVIFPRSRQEKNRYKYPQLRFSFPLQFHPENVEKKMHTKKNACHISGKLFYPVLPNFTAGQKPHATMQFE